VRHSLKLLGPGKTRSLPGEGTQVHVAEAAEATQATWDMFLARYGWNRTTADNLIAFLEGIQEPQCYYWHPLLQEAIGRDTGLDAYKAF